MVKRIDYTKCVCNSDGEPIIGTDKEMSVLFNSDIISEKEVTNLLHDGTIEFELRCAVMPRITADFLKGIPTDEQEDK